MPSPADPARGRASRSIRSSVVTVHIPSGRRRWFSDPRPESTRTARPPVAKRPDGSMNWSSTGWCQLTDPSGFGLNVNPRRGSGPS